MLLCGDLHRGRVPGGARVVGAVQGVRTNAIAASVPLKEIVAEPVIADAPDAAVKAAT
jgi:hypothetical protein